VFLLSGERILKENFALLHFGCGCPTGKHGGFRKGGFLTFGEEWVEVFVHSAATTVRNEVARLDETVSLALDTAEKCGMLEFWNSSQRFEWAWQGA
jgi:hypothetical protein